jgi:hypothetical protein
MLVLYKYIYVYKRKACSDIMIMSSAEIYGGSYGIGR